MEETTESKEPQEVESGKGGNFWVIGTIALIIIVSTVWYASLRGKNSVSPAPAVSPTQNTQQPSAPSGETQGQASITIEYTDSGFSPQSFTIKTGETVEFINNSSGEMWVASAPHPAHTDYPEFDSKKSYKKGENYSFTFSKTGIWKFHNHLNPSKFGSVTVQ